MVRAHEIMTTTSPDKSPRKMTLAPENTPLWPHLNPGHRQAFRVFALGDLGRSEATVRRRLAQTLTRFDASATIAGGVTLPEGRVWSTELTVSAARALQSVLAGCTGEAVNWFVLPKTQRFRALACDMDNTCVAGETLDMAAGRAGHGPAVSALTAGSTAGALPFTESLAERARLMRGTPVATLASVGHSVTFNPGVENLVETANRAGTLTLLITGGFMPTAEVVAARLGFQICIANQIGLTEERMTGTLARPVVDGPGKRERLAAALKAAGIDASETLAIGDGANDIEMLNSVGLGIAWRATPRLRETTHFHLDHATLAAVCDLANWRS